MSRTKVTGNPILAEADEQELKNQAIIGTYEGECADANITNLNGLDITREVWENVFSSDIYKKAIEHGWYIGYLGHPEDDPDCQDFRKACIVMTEGHIDDNGKVYGKFNLINTPVGQIVKAFQDAGVIFGISVRGAGDIIQNSVDPDTFVFRGFDLVTFPAFPESIPTFSKIAASTDINQRKKYQAVCSAVANNLDSLDSIATVNTVQACFAKQSSEYKMLEARKSQILACESTSEMCVEPCENTEYECVDPRVESMTYMYLDLKEKYGTLELAYQGLQSMYTDLTSENSRRLSSIERICSSQLNDAAHRLDTVEASLKTKTAQVQSLRKQLNARDRDLSRIQGSIELKSQNSIQLEQQLKEVAASLKQSQEANRRLRSELRDISAKLREQKADNLKYKKKVESAQSTIDEKESIISAMKTQLDETVRQQSSRNESSNRDEEIEAMNSRVVAAEQLISNYQDAYANLYANAVGVRLPKLRVTANTDVTNLQKMIRSAASIPIRPDILEPTQDVDPSYFEVDDEVDADTLVTL